MALLRKQLLDSTRGRIVTVLRAGAATADELASSLGLTRSAIRSQLTAMERDGVVSRAGQRPGTTRPAHVFVLTPETEQLLSGAYLPVLTELVDVAIEELTTVQLHQILRSVGRRVATHITGGRRPAGDVHARVVFTSGLLNDQLGAATRVERNGSIAIRGSGCPLAALTGKHQGVCLAMESLIAHAIGGVEVQERCDRTDRPRCGFEIRET
jgi:predicted ArsR family transcriptional regulator